MKKIFFLLSFAFLFSGIFSGIISDGLIRHADASDTPYVIRNVRVDITAENAVTARENALISARRQAYERLASNIDRLPASDSVKDSDISTLIDNFEIKEENLSTVRYIATLDISFDPDAIDYFIAYQNSAQNAQNASLDSPYSAALNTSTQPHILLPWLKFRNSYYLWGDNNPWKDTWQGILTQTHPLANTLILPQGGIEDIRDFSVGSPLTYPEGNLDILKQRYGASNVIIAVFTAYNSSGSVILYKPDASGVPVRVSSLGVQGRYEDSSIFKRAAFSVLDIIQKNPKILHGTSAPLTQTPYNNSVNNAAQDTQNAYGHTPYIQTPIITSAEPRDRMPQERTQSLTARYQDLSEWVTIKGRLENIPDIRPFSINSVSPSGAVISLPPSVELSSLGNILIKHGLKMAPNSRGAGFEITLAPQGLPLFQQDSAQNIIQDEATPILNTGEYR